MITISPVDLLVRVASATVGASEVPANTNAGPYVERVLARTGTAKGNPWCAAWVTDVGVTALGDAWPIPHTASVQNMAEWAQTQGCRYLALSPQVGDVFVLWFPALKRYAHTGIVTGVNGKGAVTTVEGNTSGGGSRDGWLVAARTRTLGKMDRLIRWTEVVSPTP